MNGGILVVSRHVKLHEHYRKELNALGFRDVTMTSASNEALNTVINEAKPRLMIVGAGFYACSTAFMMGSLLERFPYLNIAGIAKSDYPAEYMVDFINCGIKSCINKLDGMEQYYEGLECIRNGKTFISESVQERIDLRNEMPERARFFTPQQLEIAKLISNDFSTKAIGGLLGIAERTIYYQKGKIYSLLNVKSGIGFMRAVITLKIVDPDDLIFVPNDYVAKPIPENRKVKKPGRNMYLVKSAPKTIEKKEICC
jgi:DNA-binding NarL/FixJ family response regulator